jgi:hypothetical protein
MSSGDRHIFSRNYVSGAAKRKIAKEKELREKESLKRMKALTEYFGGHQAVKVPIPADANEIQDDGITNVESISTQDCRDSWGDQNKKPEEQDEVS